MALRQWSLQTTAMLTHMSCQVQLFRMHLELQSLGRIRLLIVLYRQGRMLNMVVAADEDEDVWAFNNGEKWGDEPPADEGDD